MNKKLILSKRKRELNKHFKNDKWDLSINPILLKVIQDLTDRQFVEDLEYVLYNGNRMLHVDHVNDKHWVSVLRLSPSSKKTSKKKRKK